MERSIRMIEIAVEDNNPR